MKKRTNGDSSNQEEQLEDLLYQALETEIGGVAVYENAIRCARHPDLKREWKKYLAQTREHEQVLRDVLDALGLDAEKETPGRVVVRQHGACLVHMMGLALKNGTPEAAELVAAECVVTAETKDHQNWQLIGELATSASGKKAKVLAEAHERVEDEEEEHLYHTRGWTRELWLASLGLPAVLPPPEEERDVKTAVEAAKAKDDRRSMTKARE